MSFFQFDSLEDMQEFIKESGDAALAAMSDTQRTLTWGSYAMMPTQDFMVFGYVFTREEVEAGERGAGASEDEVDFAVRAIAAHLERGMLFGRWFSLACPEGELGTNHAVNCWPIDSHQFNIMASFDWDSAKAIRKEEGAWLADKYIEMATATAMQRRSN